MPAHDDMTEAGEAAGRGADGQAARETADEAARAAGDETTRDGDGPAREARAGSEHEAGDGAEREAGDGSGQEAGDEPRELLLMRAGGLAFAVYAEEVETVTPLSRPAPLPHAPPAVLGVVSARGRMRTVLDPAQLLREPAEGTGPESAAESPTKSAESPTESDGSRAESDSSATKPAGASAESVEASEKSVEESAQSAGTSAESAEASEKSAGASEKSAEASEKSPAQAYDFVACLRGDEQLALAFESAGRAHLGEGELVAAHETTELPVRGRLAGGGGAVFLLDPSKLFAAAMRGTERRRTRRAR